MKKKPVATASPYTYLNHGINGLIGYVAYVVLFLVILKVADVWLGGEVAREKMPTYVVLYIGACTLLATFVVLRKVKHDTGFAKDTGMSLMIYSLLSFTVQFIALNVLFGLGLAPIEMLVYFSVLVVTLLTLTSYRLYALMFSGRRTQKGVR